MNNVRLAGRLAVLGPFPFVLALLVLVLAGCNRGPADPGTGFVSLPVVGETWRCPACAGAVCEACYKHG